MYFEKGYLVKNFWGGEDFILGGEDSPPSPMEKKALMYKQFAISC